MVEKSVIPPEIRAEVDGIFDSFGFDQGLLFGAICAALAIERERAEKAEKENVRLIEDRARFPDRPDDIGRMIGCHFGNLKAGKDAADEHASNAFDRALRAESSLAEAKRLLKVFGDYANRLDAATRGFQVEPHPDSHVPRTDFTFGELRGAARFLAQEADRD